MSGGVGIETAPAALRAVPSRLNFAAGGTMDPKDTKREKPTNDPLSEESQHPAGTAAGAAAGGAAGGAIGAAVAGPRRGLVGVAGGAGPPGAAAGGRAGTRGT